MDLIYSPLGAQRAQIRRFEKLFYHSGSGCYDEIKLNKPKCEAFCRELMGDRQLQKLKADFDLPLHGFFFPEHAFCGDRKFENLSQSAELEREQMLGAAMETHGVATIGELLRAKYCDEEKEQEYQRVLDIMRRCQ